MDQSSVHSKRILSVVEWLVFIGILAVGLIVLSPLLPTKNFISSYSVVSGSMEPTIMTGALALVKQPDNAKNLSRGTIIALSSPQNQKITIIHRIYKVNSSAGLTSYQTKGDNNQSADSWIILPSAIKGVYISNIPYLGYAITWMQTPIGFTVLIGFPALLFVLLQIRKIRQGVEEEVARRSAKAAASQSPSSPMLSIVILGLVVVSSLTVVATSAYALFSSKVDISGITLGVINPTPTPTPASTGQIVINEIYYQVDAAHGLDSSSDQVAPDCTQTIITNTGNNVSLSHFCSTSSQATVNSQNSSITTQNSTTTITTGSNTQSNQSSSSATTSGGSTIITNQSSDSNSQTTVITGNGNSAGQNNEWLELYNLGSTAVNLKNWTITDNSGTATKITANKSIPAHGFALISKDDSTWSNWSVPNTAVKIELGSSIGNGLDNGGDRVILKDPNGTVIDQLSYGLDTSVFNPAISLVPLGYSLTRHPTGFDTNQASDFVPNSQPDPGQ